MMRTRKLYGCVYEPVESQIYEGEASFNCSSLANVRSGSHVKFTVCYKLVLRYPVICIDTHAQLQEPDPSHAAGRMAPNKVSWAWIA